jgi:hypothetical protein
MLGPTFEFTEPGKRSFARVRWNDGFGMIIAIAADSDKRREDNHDYTNRQLRFVERYDTLKRSGSSNFAP